MCYQQRCGLFLALTPGKKYYYMRGLDGFFSSLKGSNRFRILCIGHNQKSLSGIFVPLAINKSGSSILVK